MTDDETKHEATQDEIKAARERGQLDGFNRKLGGSNKAGLGEGIEPREYDNDTTHDRAMAWVEGYNEGLGAADQADGEKAADDAKWAGHAAGAAYASTHTPAFPGQVPAEVNVPPQYAAHAAQYKEGFYDGFPKVEGPKLTTPEPEPANEDEARERAEAYVHLHRKIQEKIDPSYVREWEAKWGAFPHPELEPGEERAPDEVIVLHEQPHIEVEESGVVE